MIPSYFRSTGPKRAAMFLALSAISHLAYGITCEVAINDINTRLVPKTLVAGDREFGGNGPEVWSNVRLKITDDGRKLRTDVFFRAKETKADWSETKQNFKDIVVWEAPPGQRVERILSDQFSDTYFISQSAGFQILAPTADWTPIIDAIVQLARTISGDSGDSESELLEICRVIGEPDLEKCKEFPLVLDQENHVHVLTPAHGNLVSAFFIVGDTGGDDISTDDNPKDDTRIEKIAFNKIRLELAGASSCPSLPPGRSGGVRGSSSPLTFGGPSSPMKSASCAQAAQGKVAWDYKGNKTWPPADIERLCKGAEQSDQPARCFKKVMHGGISWGGGTQWNWRNAIDLCEGSSNAESTLSCFTSAVKKGSTWQEAIKACGR